MPAPFNFDSSLKTLSQSGSVFHIMNYKGKGENLCLTLTVRGNYLCVIIVILVINVMAGTTATTEAINAVFADF